MLAYHAKALIINTPDNLYNIDPWASLILLSSSILRLSVSIWISWRQCDQDFLVMDAPDIWARVLMSDKPSLTFGRTVRAYPSEAPQFVLLYE
jgi:hypothetical protein